MINENLFGIKSANLNSLISISYSSSIEANKDLQSDQIMDQRIKNSKE